MKLGRQGRFFLTECRKDVHRYQIPECAVRTCHCKQNSSAYRADFEHPRIVFYTTVLVNNFSLLIMKLSRTIQLSLLFSHCIHLRWCFVLRRLSLFFIFSFKANLLYSYLISITCIKQIGCIGLRYQWRPWIDFFPHTIYCNFDCWESNRNSNHISIVQYVVKLK